MWQGGELRSPTRGSVVVLTGYSINISGPPPPLPLSLPPSWSRQTCRCCADGVLFQSAERWLVFYKAVWCERELGCVGVRGGRVCFLQVRG